MGVAELNDFRFSNVYAKVVDDGVAFGDKKDWTCIVHYYGVGFNLLFSCILVSNRTEAFEVDRMAFYACSFAYCLFFHGMLVVSFHTTDS